jgi:hypothetical protein
MKDWNFVTDETVIRNYEFIREQVAADARSVGPYRFMGLAARERANNLLDELRRRRVAVSPIDWPDDRDNKE